MTPLVTVLYIYICMYIYTYIYIFRLLNTANIETLPQIFLGINFISLQMCIPDFQLRS